MTKFSEAAEASIPLDRLNALDQGELTRAIKHIVHAPAMEGWRGSFPQLAPLDKPPATSPVDDEPNPVQESERLQCTGHCF